jgi:hypothetical protein
VSQRVVGGDSGAKQRSRFGVLQTFRDGHQGLDWRNHVLLVSTVVADAAHLSIAAIAKIASAALATRVVVPAMPTYTGALSLCPGGNTGTYFVDDARDFMPRNPRILKSRP